MKQWSRRLSERVQSLSPSGIRKFFDLVADADDVLSLGVGEPDFVTPWPASEAGIYAVENGCTSYTSNYGILELRRGIAKYLNDRWGLNYDPKSEILVTVGVSEALDLAIRALIDPGDEVLVPEPTYVSYEPMCLMALAAVKPLKTNADTGFKVTPDMIRAAITPRTKILLMSYPNNPTGVTYTLEELKAIAKVVEENDLTVIADEIYGELVYHGKHVSFPTIKGMRDRTVLLNGFSKSYAMTGWRIGFIAAPPEPVEAMMKIHQYAILCAPVMGQKVAIEALKMGNEPVESMRREYDRRRRVIIQGFRTLELPCVEPGGAFYTFPSIAHTGLTSDEFCERLFMEERVVTVPGSAFGPSGEGHIRCAYAASIKTINQALERMDKFLARLRKK